MLHTRASGASSRGAHLNRYPDMVLLSLVGGGRSLSPSLIWPFYQRLPVVEVHDIESYRVPVYSVSTLLFGKNGGKKHLPFKCDTSVSRLEAELKNRAASRSLP